MQTFCKRGKGVELGIFKKEGGRSCKQRQGEHWKTMFKNQFGNFKGRGKIDTGGGGRIPPAPQNTPLLTGK